MSWAERQNLLLVHDLPYTFVISRTHVTHNFNAKRARKTPLLLADASVYANIRVTVVQSEKLFDLNLKLTNFFTMLIRYVMMN